MKKGLFLLSGLVLFCTGCSTARPESSVPAYFAPIAQELESDWENIMDELPEFNAISTWRAEEWPWTGHFEGNTYQAYCDGEWLTPFDLEDELVDSQEGDPWRNILGVYQESGSDNLYVCLNASDLVWDQQESEHIYKNDQILLLEYSTSQPQNYQVTAKYRNPQYSPGINPYTYCLGDRIYISADYNKLMAIDLNTKELSYCDEEYKAINEYAVEKFDKGAVSFAVVYEQEDVTVYSGAVMNDEAVPATRGMVFVAFRDGKPIARMCADFTAGGSAEGIEIEQL